MLAVRAILTCDFGKKGRRQIPVTQVEGFAVDTAQDTDADAFSIDIGAPDADFRPLLDRDTEILVNIFTQGTARGQVEPLHLGVVDMLNYSTDDMVISMSGRDLSCIATDSQAPPGQWTWIRPERQVAKDARKLGITKMKLAQVSPIQKFYTDASESYWEKWYRMYRKKKMWMWMEPDGTLRADKLHYANSPTYYFGRPKRGVRNRTGWIPVERCSFSKNTQQRVGEIWVFGERGDMGFVAKAKDPSMATWKRKSLKIITSSDAKNRAEARLEAYEEIFEGKVGSLEISLTVPYDNVKQTIRQNTMAMVNIPEIGLGGLWYVVGVQPTGSISTGYSQVVRLREKNYAISRRVPSDPKLKDPGDPKVPGDIGTGLNLSVRWGDAFASAAQEFNGGWKLSLFLGVLLSMCQKESSFRNERQSSDIEWYPKPDIGDASHQALLDKWYDAFANHAGNPRNPLGRNEAGVGPMQLTDRGFKEKADEYGGKQGEYEGGRWVPAANIRESAAVLAGKLSGVDPGNDENIWIGVAAYNGSGAAADQYAKDVKAIWKATYKDVAESAVDSAASVTTGTTTDVTVKDQDGNPFTVQVPDNAPDDVKRMINYAIRQLGKPYAWGHSGPNDFDCSGLCWAAARAGGYTGGRFTTYTGLNLSAPIPKDKLLPGDFVFFAKAGDVHHMAMYLNDGHFIQAPHTGDIVKITPLSEPYYAEQYYGARRIFNWTGRGVSSGD